MKKNIHFATTALVFALLAFFLGPVIWQDPSGMHTELSLLQLIFFIGISAAEALAFGYGMAYLFFGWPSVRSIFGRGIQAKAVFASIVWLLISWWPHDNFHRINGEDVNGLLVITYAFHITLILAGVILVQACWGMFRGYTASNR